MTLAGSLLCIIIVVRLLLVRNYDRNIRFFFSMTLLVGIFQNIGYFGGPVESLTLDRFMMLVCICYWGIFNFLIKSKGVWHMKKSVLYATLGLLVAVLAGVVNIGMNSSRALVALPQTNIDDITLGRAMAMQPVLGSYTVNAVVWLLVFVVFCAIGYSLLRDQEYMLQLREQVIKSFYIFFIFMLVEFLYSNLFSPDACRQLINEFCGVVNQGSTYMTGMKRFGFYVAYGLYSEPSYVYSILIYYLLILKRGFRSGGECIWYLLSFVALAVTGSALCYSVILIGAAVAIYQIFFKQTKREIKVGVISVLLLVAVVGIVVVMNSQGLSDSRDSIINKLHDYLSNTKSNNSGYLRNAGNALCYNVLKYNPLFGVGIGTTRGFGILPGTLATLGIVGTALLARYYKVMFNLNIKENKLQMIILLVFFTTIYTTWHGYSPVIIAVLMSMNNFYINKKTYRSHEDEKSINCNA